MKKIVTLKSITVDDSNESFTRYYVRTNEGECYCATGRTTGIDFTSATEGMKLLVNYYERESNGKTYKNATHMTDMSELDRYEQLLAMVEVTYSKVEELQKQLSAKAGTAMKPAVKPAVKPTPLKDDFPF